MAIGSAPEIGTKFTTWGQMDEASRQAWFDHMRNDWGPTLVTGYGTLVMVERRCHICEGAGWDWKTAADEDLQLDDPVDAYPCPACTVT